MNDKDEVEIDGKTGLPVEEPKETLDQRLEDIQKALEQHALVIEALAKKINYYEELAKPFLNKGQQTQTPTTPQNPQDLNSIANLLSVIKGGNYDPENDPFRQIGINALQDFLRIKMRSTKFKHV